MKKMLLLPLAPLFAVAAATAAHAQAVPTGSEPPVETGSTTDTETPTDQSAPAEAR